jgi:hypothetical protein
VEIPIRAGERTLCSSPARDGELLGIQLLPPFGIALLYLRDLDDADALAFVRELNDADLRRRSEK